MSGMNVTLHILALNCSSSAQVPYHCPGQTWMQRYSCASKLLQCRRPQEPLQLWSAARKLTEACKGHL